MPIPILLPCDRELARVPEQIVEGLAAPRLDSSALHGIEHLQLAVNGLGNVAADGDAAGAAAKASDSKRRTVSVATRRAPEGRAALRAARSRRGQRCPAGGHGACRPCRCQAKQSVMTTNGVRAVITPSPALRGLWLRWRITGLPLFRGNCLGETSLVRERSTVSPSSETSTAVQVPCESEV